MSRPSAGDAIAVDSRVIEVRVGELRQLFNAIDPSPFRERDLDPRADEFIVEWARDLPRDAPLALRVHLERAAGRVDEATLLQAPRCMGNTFAPHSEHVRNELLSHLQLIRIYPIVGHQQPPSSGNLR